MMNKRIWEHLNKELAKANTLVDLYQKILKSVLFTKARYNIFIITILDSYMRVIFLTIYHLFDKNYSWCLYSLPDLSDEEKKKIQELQVKAKKYIDVRHAKIGHSSMKVKLEEHRRFEWLLHDELEKVKELFTEIGKFLNSYGMKKFNGGSAHRWGGPDTSLQCLVEDLEKSSFKA